MKFTAALLVVAAFLAVALAVPHHKEGHVGTSCEYHCDEIKVDKPICASDGSCIRNLPNECELEMYNCVNHPAKQFELLDEKKCSEKSLPLCS